MVDISTIQGDTRRLGIPVFDADRDQLAELIGVQEIVYKITDEEGGGQTILEKDDSDPDVCITTADDIDTVELEDYEPDTAVVSVWLRPDETEEFPIETLFHELQLTDAAGNVTTVVQGQVDVIPSST